MPAANELTTKGKLIELAEPTAVPVHDKLPVPDPVISIDPSVAEHALGLAKLPNAITGLGNTVTFVLAEDEEQPETVTVTLYELAVDTTID